MSRGVRQERGKREIEIESHALLFTHAIINWYGFIHKREKKKL